MRVHSLKKRLQAVRLCLSGMAYTSVAKQLGLDNHSVAEWVCLYKRAGIAGLRCRKPRRYSAEEKCAILSAYAKKTVPLYELSATYHVSQSRIKCWARQLRSGRTLLSTNRINKKFCMGRPRKRAPQTELERLEEELRYLRAENAYLKKLRALRIAKEQQQAANKLKSSNP